MHINQRELSLVISEANTLSSKPSLNKQEERRLTYLMSAAAAIRSGASLADVEIENHNAVSRANGLPVMRKTSDGLTQEQRDTAKLWKYAAEQRDVEGAPMISHIGQYTNLGTFVPTEFFGNVVAQMKAHDPLFDEDFCTVLNSTTGRIQTIPVMSDIANVASIVSEAGTQNATDIYNPGHVVLPVFAYKTPRWTASIEAFQDLSEVVDSVKLFTDFASDRLRRGIGNDLVNGFGDNVMPLGLLASIEALGSQATPLVIATGSSSNTGGAETGGNTIGTNDLYNLFYSIDSAYRANPKCAWLMSDVTLNYIDSLLDKYGRPIRIVKYDVNGNPTIFGKRVRVSPSMPSVPGLGALTSPLWSIPVVCFGDFSYWFTKIVTGVSANGMPLGYVQTYTEGVGLIENGLIGFRAFLRAGGVLAVNDTKPFGQVDKISPAPLNVLITAATN